MRNFVKKATAALVLVSSLFVQKAVSAYSCFYESTGPYMFSSNQSLSKSGVDMGTGAFVYKVPLISVYTPGVMLKGEININTQDASQGPFGPGTSGPYDYYIIQSPIYAGDYELVTPGNRHYTFDATVSYGIFADTKDLCMLGANLNTIYAAGQPPYTLVWKNGTRYQFDSYGGLIKIIDRHNNTVTVVRDNNTGFVTKVYNNYNSNRYVAFNLDNGYYNGYSQNQVSSVVAQYGAGGTLRTWNIGYDTAYQRRIASIRQPNGYAYTYTWTTYNRSYPFSATLPLLTRVTDPFGNAIAQMAYNAYGFLTSYTNSLGGVYTFTWSPVYGWGYVSSSVVVREPNGHTGTTNISWNPNYYGYKITSIVDNTLGTTTTVGYTGLVPSSVVDYRGRTISYSRNAYNGDLTSVSIPNGAGGTATWNLGHDPLVHTITSVTTPLSNSISRTLDSSHNIVSSISPLGSAHSFGYSPAGILSSTTDPSNNTITWGLDGNGFPTTAVDALGNVTHMSRNDTGTVAAITDPLGVGISSISYDTMSHPTSVNYPSGPVSYSYNAVYEQTSMTDAMGHTTQCAYDTAGNVVSKTRPDGTVVRFTYDNMGHLASRTDAVGNVMQCSYDGAGRLSSITYKRPNGTVESTITYNYDPTTKKVSSIVDSIGGTTSFTYDSLDRVATKTTPTGTISYAYDVIGRVVSATVSGQSPVTYAYNGANQITSVTHGTDTFGISYDGNGRLASVTYPNGVTTQRTLTANLLCNMACSSNANNVVFDNTTYTYDNSGRCTSVNNNGVTSTVGYNNCGRRCSVSDTLGHSYTFTYDSNGCITGFVANGSNHTRTYNVNSDLSAVDGTSIVRDADGRPTSFGSMTFTWDTRGQLVGYTAGGHTVSYVYDGQANRISSTVDGTTTYIMYDRNLPVVMTKNGVSNFIVWSPSLGGPLTYGSLYNITNGSGSTTKVMSGSSVVGTKSYDIWGHETATGTTIPFGYMNCVEDTAYVLMRGSTGYVPDWGTWLQGRVRGGDVGLGNYSTPQVNTASTTKPNKIATISTKNSKLCASGGYNNVIKFTGGTPVNEGPVTDPAIANLDFTGRVWYDPMREETTINLLNKSLLTQDLNGIGKFPRVWWTGGSQAPIDPNAVFEQPNLLNPYANQSVAGYGPPPPNGGGNVPPGSGQGGTPPPSTPPGGPGNPPTPPTTPPASPPPSDGSGGGGNVNDTPSAPSSNPGDVPQGETFVVEEGGEPGLGEGLGEVLGPIGIVLIIFHEITNALHPTYHYDPNMARMNSPYDYRISSGDIHHKMVQ